MAVHKMSEFSLGMILLPFANAVSTIESLESEAEQSQAPFVLLMRYAKWPLHLLGQSIISVTLPGQVGIALARLGIMTAINVNNFLIFSRT